MSGSLCQSSTLIAWLLRITLKMFTFDGEFNGTSSVPWIGQYLAPFFCICYGWSPVAPQAVLTSVPSHRHYLPTLKTSLREELDSCAPQAVIGVSP